MHPRTRFHSVREVNKQAYHIMASVATLGLFYTKICLWRDCTCIRMWLGHLKWPAISMSSSTMAILSDSWTPGESMGYHMSHMSSAKANLRADTVLEKTETSIERENTTKLAKLDGKKSTHPSLLFSLSPLPRHICPVAINVYSGMCQWW